jgi:hypothetical protein
VRTLAIVALLCAAAPASADRSAAISIGLLGDARATGDSFSAAGSSHDISLLGGMEGIVSFEHAPLAIPAPGEISADLRLSPELLAGFVADDVHAEGMVGAGLRGELALAANRRAAMRTTMYVAARGVVIGGHHDGAAQIMVGEYLTFATGNRFGWEGGAMLRPRSGVSDDRARELDTLVNIYFGWR